MRRRARWEVTIKSALTPNLLVFLAVVTARFALPLAIPRFPLPAIVTCLIPDGVD